MDYLSQLNAVADLSVENMTPNDFAVYMRMLFFNNTLHWKEWFSITYERLCHLTGINSKHTIATALNSLEQNGYIEVKRLGKRQGNKYKIVPLYSSDYALKAEQKRNINGTKTEQKRNKNGTKAEPLIRLDKTRLDETTISSSDYLTNIEGENQGNLTPAEEKAKAAFEQTFHPLTKLKELDALKAYVGDYGVKSVLWAIEEAGKSKQDTGDRVRLSPKYLLPILKRRHDTVESVKEPDMDWQQGFPTQEEQEAHMRRAVALDDLLAEIAAKEEQNGQSG